MREVGRNEVLDLLTEVVAEAGPDFVYKSPGQYCRYEYKGQPSCLVGRVLNRLGVPVEALAGLDEDYPAVNDVDFVSLGLSLPDDAVIALQAVQEWQDEGNKWGDALPIAANVMRLSREELMLS